MSSEEVNSIPFLRSSIGERIQETNLAAGLRAALIAHQPAACQQLALRAGQQRDVSTAALLSDTLLPSATYRRLKAKSWAGARLAAVHALGNIGAEHALPALACALLDPEPAIQQAAADILVNYGSQALPALSAVLHQNGDWPLSGMKRLVTTIGRLQTPESAKLLTAVTLAGLPFAPPRWDRPLLYSIRAAAGTALAGALLAIVGTGSIGMGLVTLFLLAITNSFLWVLVALFGVLPYRALRESTERNAVAMLAAEHLRVAGDKKYLPEIIEGAFGYNRMSPRPARRALRHLLPHVNSEDADRLPFGARSKLMDALGKGHGSDMDVAILGALEWIGTGSVAEKVARMAQQGATPAVREEAARILPILQERQRQEQAPSVLLRASHTASPANQLLRPGVKTEDAPAEQLLRAGNAE